MFSFSISFGISIRKPEPFLMYSLSYRSGSIKNIHSFIYVYTISLYILILYIICTQIIYLLAKLQDENEKYEWICILLIWGLISVSVDKIILELLLVSRLIAEYPIQIQWTWNCNRKWAGLSFSMGMGGKNPEGIRMEDIAFTNLMSNGLKIIYYFHFIFSSFSLIFIKQIRIDLYEQTTVQAYVVSPAILHPAGAVDGIIQSRMNMTEYENRKDRADAEGLKCM